MHLFAGESLTFPMFKSVLASDNCLINESPINKEPRMLLLCATDNALAVLDPESMIATRTFYMASRIPVFATIRCMALLERAANDLWIIITDDGMCTWMAIRRRVASFAIERVYQMTIGPAGLNSYILGHHVCCDPKGRALAMSALENNVSIWNLDKTTGLPQQNVVLKSIGTIWKMTFLFPKSDDGSGIILAMAIVRKRELVIILYEALSLLNWQQSGEYSLGKDVHPLQLTALPNLPETMLLSTDTGAYVISASDIRPRAIMPQKVEIPGPFHSKEIPERLEAVVSKVIPVPGSDIPYKQTLYMATDAGNLIRLFIDGTHSRPTITFQHVAIPTRPIWTLAFLGKAQNRDILAIFGDMCQGEIAMISPYEISHVLTIPNMSPTLDAILLETKNKKDSKIVTTCGLSNGGLVESRKGIPVRILVSNPDFEGVNGLWSLKRNESEADHCFLVVSFVSQTRVMKIEDGELEDISDISGLDIDSTTLYASSHPSLPDTVWQVTASNVLLARIGSGCLARWSSNRPITMCYSSADLVVLITVDNRLVALRSEMISDGYVLGSTLIGSVISIQEIGNRAMELETSCIYIPDLGALTGSKTPYCIVGTYRPSFSIFSLKSDSLLEKMHEEVLESNQASSLPNAFRLLPALQNPILLVGLRGGELLIFLFDWIKGLPRLTFCEAKKIGLSPVTLPDLLLSEDDLFVIACSEEPVFLSFSDKSIQALPILCSQLLYAVPFALSGTQNTYMVVTDNQLCYVQLCIDQKIQNRVFPVADIPRRVIYDPESNQMIVTTWKKTGADIQSDLKLVCPLSGECQHALSMPRNENIYALARWDVEHSSRPGKRYICVGTTDADSTGRVLIYSLKPRDVDPVRMDSKQSSRFKKLGEIALHAGVRFIKSFMQSYLLVGAGNKLYRLKIEATTRKYVAMITQFSRLSIADTLDFRWPIECIDIYPMPEGSFIAVACQKDSISLYKYASQSKKFDFIASDRISRLPTSIHFINSKLIMGTDKLGNVFGLYNRGIDENSIEESLDCIVSYHVGEPLVKLMAGSLVHDYSDHSISLDASKRANNSFNAAYHLDFNGKHPLNQVSDFDLSSLKIAQQDYVANLSENPWSIDRVLYAVSITGSIYGFLPISSLLFDKLLLLQTLMAANPDVLPVFGKRYGAFRSSHGVIDGQLLSRFLSLDSAIQTRIADSWNVAWEQQSHNGHDKRATVIGISNVIQALVNSM